MKKKNEIMVADCLYRDGANYKMSFLFKIPKGVKLKAGETVTSDTFGISEERWLEEFCGQFAGGYDEELDHNFIEVNQIRPMQEGDIISN